MSSIKQSEIIRIAGEAGAAKALEMLAKEKKKASKERRDRRLRNTKLLLRNYRMLSAHSDGAIYASKQIEGEDSAIDILDMLESALDDEEFYVESIKRSAERTRIIMNHVNEMLRFYEGYCVASGRAEDQRRFDVLYAMYLSGCPQTAREIAEKENIDTRTVYRDIDSATERLSALLFGIDGLQY